MAKPVIAVVGRPNVGKSTLFNKLVGQRLSIVEDTPGVTRDRIYAAGEWLGREFMLVDPGGIEPKSSDVILAQMRRQAQLAILHLVFGRVRPVKIYRQALEPAQQHLVDHLQRVVLVVLLHAAVVALRCQGVQLHLHRA